MFSSFFFAICLSNITWLFSTKRYLRSISIKIFFLVVRITPKQLLSQCFYSFSREIKHLSNPLFLVQWNIQHMLKFSIPAIPYFCDAAFAILVRKALDIAPFWSSRLKINSLTMPPLCLSLHPESCVCVLLLFSALIFKKGYDINIWICWPWSIPHFIALGISYSLWFSDFLNHSRKSPFKEEKEGEKTPSHALICNYL